MAVSNRPYISGPLSRESTAKGTTRLRRTFGTGLLAAVFHVAPNGVDTNPGTADAPWRTLDKVAAADLRPGDSVLFARGGAWHGQLLAQHDGDAGRPITYADYGDPKLAPPTFYGSDDVTPRYTTVGPSVYTFPTAAGPTGRVFWVYLDHKPLLAATAGGPDMPAGSFFVRGDTVFVQTAGRDPAKAVVSVGDRATGQNPDQGVLCSNAHSHLVFRNLVGRETAQVPDGGDLKAGIIDAYVIRVQGGRDVRLDHCEAYYGGKHNVGATDTTEFVADHVRAAGAVNGAPGNTLGYGHATAFVSYASGQVHDSVHTWTSCTVADYPADQPAFITHNDGADSFASLTVDDLHVAGSPIALMPGPNVTIAFHGGVFENVDFAAYTAAGAVETFDGLTFTGPRSSLAVNGHATVERCAVTGSAQDGGIRCGGPGDVVRDSAVAMAPGAACAIRLAKDAKDTALSGNQLTGAATPVRSE